MVRLPGVQGGRAARRILALWPLTTLAAVSYRGLFILAALILGLTLLVFVMVVNAAIWCKKKTRRDAALAVLKIIFGRN